MSVRDAACPERDSSGAKGGKGVPRRGRRLWKWGVCVEPKSYQDVFNELVHLATGDPAAFEQRRRKIVAPFMSRPTAGALPAVALQCAIDVERVRAGNPAAGYQSITSILRGSLMALAAALGDLGTALDAMEREANSAGKRAS